MKHRESFGSTLETYTLNFLKKNIGETDKFLDIYDISKLNQEHIKSLQIPIIVNKINIVLKFSQQ